MVIMNVVTRMTRKFLKRINRIDDLLMMAAIMVMITYDGDVEYNNNGDSKDSDGNDDCSGEDFVLHESQLSWTMQGRDMWSKIDDSWTIDGPTAGMF